MLQRFELKISLSLFRYPIDAKKYHPCKSFPTSNILNAIFSFPYSLEIKKKAANFGRQNIFIKKLFKNYSINVDKKLEIKNKAFSFGSLQLFKN